MGEKLVREKERVDDLQNGYYVIQDPDKFCFGMDAVLLSGFAKVKKSETGHGYGNRYYSDSSESKDSGKAFYRSGDSEGMCRDGQSQCKV